MLMRQAVSGRATKKSMSKSRMVTTRFWSDQFIVDELNPLDRYLFLYLLTNEKTNLIGIYELSLRTASFETGIEIDNLKAMLKRLSPKIEYVNGWIYLTKFVDHQSSSPKLLVGMEREAESLPDDVKIAIQKVGFPSVRLHEIFNKMGYGIYTVSYGMHMVPLTKHKLKEKKLKETTNVDSADESADGVEKSGSSNPVKPGEIDKLFVHWKEKVGTNIGNTRTNRDYASKLIRQYGFDQTMKFIEGAGLAAEDRYAPSIANFSDLYRKIDKLMLWGKKRMGDNGDKPKVIRV